MPNQKKGTLFLLLGGILSMVFECVTGFKVNVPLITSRLLGSTQAPICKLRASAFDPSNVRAISLDITGTILVHRYPIMQTYADAAVWAKLPNPPSAEELKPGNRCGCFSTNELDTE